MLILLAAFIVAAALRAWRATGLDIFEDGYHHWYIAANLRDSGVLDDRISGMTGGNWLPMYYYVAAGALLASGSSSIFILKGLGIAFSLTTMLFIFLIGERWRRHAGVVAAFLFALNPLDILLSSMSLPDGLALALVSAALYLFIFHPGKKAPLLLAGVLLAAAAATRYEAWVIIPLVFAFVVSDPGNRTLGLPWRLAVFFPAAAFMITWLAVQSQHGFLGGTVLGQTSLQPAIVGERTGLDGPRRAGLFWLLYGANEAVLMVLAGAFYIRGWIRREPLHRGLRLLSAILLLFIVLLSVLVASGLMVGSYRYLSYTTLAIGLAAAGQITTMSSDKARPAAGDPAPGRRVAIATGAAMILLLPSMFFSFVSADSASGLNEPQVSTGLWLRDHLPPGNYTVLIDSPIAAYYSGLPPSRIAGSAELPDNLTKAREHVLSEVGCVVFVDHRFFRLAQAFPELGNGRSTGHFRFVFSPNDWRVAFGALPTYVYLVDKSERTFPSTGNLSLRFGEAPAGRPAGVPLIERGALLVEREIETAGGGAGFGLPALNWSGRTYFPTRSETLPIQGGVSKTFVLDAVGAGDFARSPLQSAARVWTVNVRYSVNGSVLSIDADLSGLPRNATLIMLNEQDGSRYSRYLDFDGIDHAMNTSIKRVTAWYNYLLDADGRGFRVDYTPRFENASRLYLHGSFQEGGPALAGLDYFVDLSGFAATTFRYEVRLVEA